MKATVVGSGTSIPTPDRASPCFHLALGEVNIVFDAGSGSLGQMARIGIDIRSITALIFSHFHPDHTADLVPFLFALKNPELGASGSLTLGGPAGMKSLLEKLEGIHGDWIRPGNVQVDIAEYEPGLYRFNGWSLSCARTGHTPESLAYRVDCGGKSVVYSGDTPFDERIIALAAGVDLLVLECSFPEGPERKGHLIPSQAGEIARRAKAGRLLLTHFYPAAAAADLVTPCAARYDGEILMAADGLSLVV